MPNVTVVGASGAIVTVPFTGSANYALAQQLAAIINAAAPFSITGGTGNLNATNYPTTPTGGGLTEEVITVSGAVTTGAGVNFLTDAAAGAVTVQGSPFVNMLAGTGGLTFYGASSGNTNIAAGGGNNLISLPNGSSYHVAMGPGSDTVYADGNGVVDASGGGGANLIFSSPSAANSNLIFSAGTGDTIIAGAGATTIGDNNTISGSAVSGTSATIFGGSNDLILGQAESITYIASVGGAASISGGGNDAIVGAVDSSLTLNGMGADTIEFFKGPTAGTAVITGFTSIDGLDAFGYGGSAAVTVTGGSTVVTLTDGTKITLSGFTGTISSHKSD
jgi:hypothetical protein